MYICFGPLHLRAWTKIIGETKKIYTKNSGFILLDELHTQDIDNYNDWELAELKYKLMIQLN